MKRDMDLVRQILLIIEDSPTPWIEGYLEVPGYERGPVTHHLHLLKEAGYIQAYEATDANTEYGFMMQDASLTWQGHEFLDEVRDVEIWKKTKAGAAKAGSWSVRMLGELARGYVRQRAVEFGLPLG
jgi:hypothetical protein